MTPLSTCAAAAFACVQAVLAQDPGAQPTLAELRQRIDDLEEQQARLLETVGGRAVLQAYTARSFDFGGEVSSLFTHMRGEHDDRSGHVVSLLELYLKAQLDDHFSVFATPGYYLFHGALPDDPTTATSGDPAFTSADASEARTFLSRLEAQWRHGDALQLHGGVVGSPHGTTNREYFIPARTIGQASLHTRVFLANELYPQHLHGLRGEGKLPLGSGGRLEYDVYGGVQDDAPDLPVGGARLAYVFPELGLGMAANYGAGRRPGRAGEQLVANVPLLQSPFAAEFNGERRYDFAGVDLDWRQGDFICKTELYYSREVGYRDQRAVSSEWTWFVRPTLGLSYRFDFYDRGSDQVLVALTPTPATLPLDLGFATEHVLGVCFDPNPSVRLRLDFHHLLLPNRSDEVDFVNLSWSVSF
ncbi:MAG: hypothetical protein JNN13_19400 [Planctomycetes bacterium]|nr:hypothetical protein [Planctomycetota bacterium]